MRTPNARAARRPRPAWRRRSLPAALAALTLLLSGCGTSHPPPISSAELAAARTFPYYPLYWAGRSFASHPLTAIDGVEGYKPKVGDSVYYGDCVSGNGFLGSGGCTLPLKVTTAVYALHSNVALGPQRNAIVRGVPAAIFNEGRSIELYTGRLVIDVYANTPTNAIAGARLLRPLNLAGSSASPLPLPVYCPQLAGRRPASVFHVMQHLPGGACEAAKAALAQQEELKRGP